MSIKKLLTGTVLTIPLFFSESCLSGTTALMISPEIFQQYQLWAPQNPAHPETSYPKAVNPKAVNQSTTAFNQPLQNNTTLKANYIDLSEFNVDLSWLDEKPKEHERDEGVYFTFLRDNSSSISSPATTLPTPHTNYAYDACYTCSNAIEATKHTYLFYKIFTTKNGISRVFFCRMERT